MFFCLEYREYGPKCIKKILHLVGFAVEQLCEPLNFFLLFLP